MFISHDVHFIRALAKKVLHIDSGVLTPYAGGYDYYLEKSRATNEREALVAGNALALTNGSAPSLAPQTNGVAPAFAAAPTPRKTKEQKRAEAEARAAVSQGKREQAERVRKLERDIANLETRQKTLTAELETEATYQQPGRAIQLNRELTSVTNSLARLTQEWEASAEKLEREPATT